MHITVSQYSSSGAYFQVLSSTEWSNLFFFSPYLRWFSPCPHWRCSAAGQSEVLGGAGGGGWGPGVTEGRGTARPETLARWRQTTTRGAPTKGSSSLSRTTTTMTTELLRVSPPGPILEAEQRERHKSLRDVLLILRWICKAGTANSVTVIG